MNCSFRARPVGETASFAEPTAPEPTHADICAGNSADAGLLSCYSTATVHVKGGCRGCGVGTIALTPGRRSAIQYR